MDPVSVSIGALGLVENLGKLISFFRSKNVLSREMIDLLGELQILHSVLIESKAMIDELMSRPPSLIIALQRCQETEQQLVGKVVSSLSSETTIRIMRAVHSKSKEESLKEAITTFRSSVLLFRDIATNSLTHHMLRAVSNSTKTIGEDSHIENSTLPISKTTSIGPSHLEQGQDPLLSKQLENSSLFNATISFIADAEALTIPETTGNHFGSRCVCGRSRMGVWFPVRGKFDTGSNTDFVSEDLIKRAGLENRVQQTEDVVRLRIFGVTFDFKRKIALNWQLNNHEVSYSREFWVAKDADNFDLIVGDPWLQEHGYDFIQTHQSRKATSFFGGFFSLRLGSSTKAQADIDASTDTANRNQAKEKMKKNREAALTTGPTQAGSVTNAGSSPTGSNSLTASTTLGYI